MHNTRTITLNCVFFELWSFEMENSRNYIFLVGPVLGHMVIILTTRQAVHLRL